MPTCSKFQFSRKIEFACFSGRPEKASAAPAAFRGSSCVCALSSPRTAGPPPPPPSTSSRSATVNL